MENNELLQGLQSITKRLDNIEQMLQEQRQAMFSKDTLTLEEAATYTPYSKGYLYRLTSQKKIPHFKRGKRVFFDKAALDEWLRDNPIKSDEQIQSEAETYCSTHKLK